MFIALKINVRLNVLTNMFSLCFCTSFFGKKKNETVKLLGGCQLQIKFMNWISFVFFVIIRIFFKVVMKTILGYFITL